MGGTKAIRAAGNTDIGEIAYRIGFTEPANFSRFFRLRTGLSQGSFVKPLDNQFLWNIVLKNVDTQCATMRATSLPPNLIY